MILLENDYSEEAYKATEEEAKKLNLFELLEFSARARKKKRIYKRKKVENKPVA
jgi:hypothetical protein